MFNYPDGMSGREFDTKEYLVVCTNCGTEYEDEVNTGWGEPIEFDTECPECEHKFLFHIIDDRY